jgi:hypothetical protein
MGKFVLAGTIAFAVGRAAFAQPSMEPPEGVPVLKTLPADAATVADYYKQDVYDPGDEKIGQIVDLIVKKTVWCRPLSSRSGVFSALGPSTLQFHSRHCK